MPFPDMSSSNPYGLSGPELAYVTNGGKYPESSSSSSVAAAQRTKRLETQIMAGQARITKLQGWMAAGHTTEPVSTVPLLPAQFQAGGKFALSGPEQEAAKPPSLSTTTQRPLAEQLAQKYQQVAAMQKELQQQTSLSSAAATTTTH